MQQGHPRNKQLSRARHEMYLHNTRKREEVWNLLATAFKGIGNALKTVFKGVQQSLGSDERTPVPSLDYEKMH